jgi:hypothetical protein
MITEEEIEFFNKCVRCKTQLRRRCMGVQGTANIVIELYCPACTNIQAVLNIQLTNKELLLRFFTDEKFRDVVVGQAITKFLTEQ